MTAGQSVIGSAGEVSYGEIEYSYGGHSAKSRSTSHREALPLLYGLAGVPVPIPQTGEEYPGYPLVGWIALRWFFVALPLLIAVAWWWWNRRVSRIPSQFVKNGGSYDNQQTRPNFYNGSHQPHRVVVAGSRSPAA